MPTENEITRILQDAQPGDAQSTARLLPLVYEELRRLAQQRLAHEPPGQTLQPTALVHEAYLRLIGDADAQAAGWDSCGHFFGAAAEAMRRILVERARRYQAKKHGGGRKRVLADGIDLVGLDCTVDGFLALDEALQKLEEVNQTRCDVVKLRYFAGLTIDQTALALGISPATAKRHWTCARAWLCHEIKEAESR